MITPLKKICGMILLCLLLPSCALFQNSEDNHTAICNELKHQLIFNGATSDQVLATQARAEQDNLQTSYRKEGCEP